MIENQEKIIKYTLQNSAKINNREMIVVNRIKVTTEQGRCSRKKISIRYTKIHYIMESSMDFNLEKTYLVDPLQTKKMLLH